MSQPWDRRLLTRKGLKIGNRKLVIGYQDTFSTKLRCALPGRLQVLPGLSQLRGFAFLGGSGALGEIAAGLVARTEFVEHDAAPFDLKCRPEEARSSRQAPD